MPKFRKLLITLSIVLGVSGFAVATDISPVSAAAGCTQVQSVYSDYYFTDGVWRPYTVDLTCTNTNSTNGYKFRLKVTCSYGQVFYSPWIKTLGAHVQVSCGPGLGYIASYEHQLALP